MGRKYYTSFLLQDPGEGGTRQYNGVVEIAHSFTRNMATEDVRCLLARNFKVDKTRIDVLLWSRLH